MNSASVETYNLKGLGRNELIAVIYNRYGKKLYSYALHSWNMEEDAAWELIYKTLYKVIDSYESYRFESEEKFASFIFKIFINYLRNYYRDHKNEKMFAFSAIDDVDVATETNEEGQVSKKMRALNEVLEEMQDWERMLLLMRSEGRAYSEIAQYIDKPENQLKVYYQRLKEQLTKKLNDRSE